MRVLIWIILLLGIVPMAFAANLSGAIYDFELEPTKGVLVDISTSPKQQLVSSDGTYGFVVPPGTYVLRARQLVQGKIQASTSERVVILGEGDYVIDLVLFPSLEEEEPFNVTVDDLEEVESLDLAPGSIIPWLIWAALVLIILGGGIWFRRHHIGFGPAAQSQASVKTELSADAKAVLSWIQSQEGGKTTQKDIRRNFPYSEAKMSLLITELESHGLLEKIKTGRSNDIVLKKHEVPHSRP